MGFELKYSGVVLILLMCVIIPLPGSLFCPHGWQRFKGRCYIFFRQRFVLDKIIERCKQLQASVLEIKSQRENDFVTSYMHTRYRQGDAVWLGMQGWEFEDPWQWILDGSPVYFTRWSEGQSDYDIKKEWGFQNCAVIQNGTWNAVWCYGPPHYGACSRPEDRQRYISEEMRRNLQTVT